MKTNVKLATIDEIIAEAKSGNLFIIIDDENRENEGDLVIAAEFADADKVNFMAKYGRGLICLALSDKRVAELELPEMVANNQAKFKTAFTISIEAKENITTGISAYDRAETIKAAITKTKNDLASPGHIFPLRAVKGGVVARPGHTEAAVEIAKLAGLNPSGVICEIMRDDGKMARLPELIEFAKIHNMKIATIKDLVSYVKEKSI